MPKEYVVQFNLYNASEGGVDTGHSNVTLMERDSNTGGVHPPSAPTSSYTFGVNSTGGGIGTWINPFSDLKDGRIGSDPGWEPHSGTVSSQVVISKEQYDAILSYMEPYTGPSYDGNTPINYNVFASVNPFSGDQQSCFSFVQHIYEMAGGTGSTFVDEFTDEQLDRLNNNIIDVWYGDLDFGRNYEHATGYLSDQYDKVKDTIGNLFDGLTEAVFPSAEGAEYDGTSYDTSSYGFDIGTFFSHGNQGQGTQEFGSDFSSILNDGLLLGGGNWSVSSVTANDPGFWVEMMADQAKGPVIACVSGDVR